MRLKTTGTEPCFLMGSDPVVLRLRKLGGLLFFSPEPQTTGNDLSGHLVNSPQIVYDRYHSLHTVGFNSPFSERGWENEE